MFSAGNPSAATFRGSVPTRNARPRAQLVLLGSAHELTKLTAATHFEEDGAFTLLPELKKLLVIEPE